MNTITAQAPEVKLTHLEWMYPHYHSLTAKQQARVQREIDRGSTRCYDICGEHCQLFDNVRPTMWLKEVLAENFIDEGKFGKRRKRLCSDMPDVLAIALADRKKRDLLCSDGSRVDIAAKVKELIDCRNQQKGTKQ